MTKFLAKILTILGLVALLGTILSPVLVLAKTPTPSSAGDGLRVGIPIDNGDTPTPPPGSTGGGFGGSVDTTPAQISNVSLTVTDKTATINWETNEPTVAKISWGTSVDYGAGNISEEQYSNKHSVEVPNLESGTHYLFMIIAYDTSYNTTGYNGGFETLNGVDDKAPGNVSEFLARGIRDNIQLTWNNPTDPDFDLVRIVRAENFYPLDPYNGKVIFEGKGNSYTDTDIQPGKIYYYTAFSRDIRGNFSSGSISSSTIAWFSELNGLDFNLPITDLQLPFVSGPVTNPRSFQDFTFYQNGKTVQNGIIVAGKEFEIRLPENKLPQDGEFLTLTVKDSQHHTTESTYLFTYDKNLKSYYVDTPGLKNVQPYNLVVTIFNSSKLILQRVDGSVQVVHAAEGEGGNNTNTQPLNWPGLAITVGTIGAGLLVSWHFYRRRNDFKE